MSYTTPSVTRSHASRYALALASVGLIYLAKGPVEAAVGAGPPLILFVPAVTISAWFGGLGPGLLATALTTLLCTYYFFEPVGSFRIVSPNDRLRLGAFLFESVLTSLLMSELHGAVRRAESATARAEGYRDTIRRNERRVVQAERLAAIGQMVAGLAHESRNALQRGQACLEMLTHRVSDRPEALDLLAGIQEAQDDLHRLYEEVRNYAAPIVLDRRACTPRELVREAWSRLETARRGRDVRLIEPLGPGPSCHADAFRLVQVLRNVLDNALAAIPDPAEIRVDWSEATLGGRPAVRMVVADNGPGFSEEGRAKLFEPFYTTKAQGTGLGMAIVRRIVEAHDGRIEVGPCQGEGGGAEVIITIPRGSP